MPQMEIIIVGLLSKCSYIVIKAQISCDFKGGAKQYYVPYLQILNSFRLLLYRKKKV